jgi:hypothetical protein
MASKIESPLEVMVLTCSPDDFPSWPRDRQRERHKRVIEWQDFVRSHNPSRIPYVWGAHQLLSHTQLSNLNDMHVAVYRVDHMAEFDRMMIEDPLRDCSRYVTFALASLSEDHERDLKRFNKIKQELFAGKEMAAVPEYQKLRSLYTQAPDYVGKHPPRDPPNPVIDLSARAKHEEKVEILVIESNTDPNQDFPDAQQLIVYEKVLWWADYASMLIGEGILTHGWTLHNFCDSEKFEGQREGAMGVYACESWEHFDSLYALNPVRRAGKFWTVHLQPAQQQMEQDRLRYDLALKR